jgi:hypothetical protein
MVVRIMAAPALLVLAALPVAAPQAQTPLPDVNITAPAPPSRQKGFTPYTSHTRVEEDKWPAMPCTGGLSRIDMGPGGKCQYGGAIETFMAMAGRSTVDVQCDISHQLVIADAGGYQIEADVLIFDPYKIVSGPATGHLDKWCYIWSGYRDIPAEFYDMNQVARRGTAWRNLVKADNQSTIEFNEGPHACIAVERLGPPWHGGYVWSVHATICRPTNAPLTGADIDAVFGMMKLQVYDPVGNLAGPPANPRTSATR